MIEPAASRITRFTRNHPLPRAEPSETAGTSETSKTSKTYKPSKMSSSNSTSNSLKSAFNPFNWPDRLRQRRTKNPDDPSARDVHDPHTWEDPDPSWRERLTPDTVAEWLVLGAGLLVGTGLVVYFYPVFGPAFQNPYAVAATVFLAYSLGLYLKGREDGIQAYIDLVKSIVYYGNAVDVRLGEDKGEKPGATCSRRS